jgi:SEC-C motif-containing protein
MNRRESDVCELPCNKTEFTEGAARVQDNDLARITARLTTGRNDPCPCGSDRKYKRCCLAADETFVRQAAKKCETQGAGHTKQGIQQRCDIRVATAAENRPSVEQHRAEAFCPSPNEPPEADKLWRDLELLKCPTSEQMDLFLEKFLALPPGETDWCDLFHFFASRHHNDLPTVFRRIAGVIPHTREEGISFLYWATVEEFYRRGYKNLLPEVAAGFRKLDGQNYDVDALNHLEDYLLAAGFDAETLELDEHFLPVLRDDNNLMPHVIPEVCQRIFELRVGAELCSGVDSTRSLESISQSLRCGIEEEIHEDAATYVSRIIIGQTLPGQWTRGDFDLVIGNIRTDDGVWRDFLRLNGALVRAAKQAWQVDQVAPGCAFTGLTLMLNSVYPSHSKGAKRKKTGWNLLSYLSPSGIEERLVDNCRGLLGINVPKARRLLQAHDILCRLAARHQLISDSEAARTKDELSRLYGQLQ